MNRPPRRGPSRPALAATAGLLLALTLPVRGGEEPSEEAATAGISGRVVDEEKSPVAGARVALFRDDPATRRWGPVGMPVDADAAGAYEFAGLTEGWYGVVAERAGSAKAFRYVAVEAGQRHSADVVLREPVSSSVLVRDESGRPVAGARFRSLEPRGDNGEFWFRWRQDWETFGVAVPPSDEAGRLRLPDLPEGTVVKAVIDHPDLAPAEIKDVAVGPGVAAEVVLKPGAKMAVRVVPAEPGAQVGEVDVRLDHVPQSHPSSVFFHSLALDADGRAAVAVEPGRYSTLALGHADFQITPRFSPRAAKGEYLRVGPGETAAFEFRAGRKVRARGRVVDAASGKPLAGVDVRGEIPNVGPDGQVPVGEAAWAEAGWATTDGNGEYAVDLAAGPARVSLQAPGRVAERSPVESDVAPDGSTVFPDLRAAPMPTVAGRVLDPAGRPVADAVVRLRGGLRFMQPARTDADGRFELAPPSLPLDPETGQPRSAQPLVAFHPLERLAARADVRLDQPDSLRDVTLTLGPDRPGGLIDDFRDELTLWERGEAPAEVNDARSGRTLVGQPAPELDGTWLNAEPPAGGLAGFRGKYVLLDFWFTGCGPCHGEFPSVELLHELYRDRGLVVVAVHDNSAAAEEVRRHATERGLTFPILVDEPDGRTIARYEGRGLDGYPSYVLIGPDGTVVEDDYASPGPTLRFYKIELLRERLLR